MPPFLSASPSACLPVIATCCSVFLVCRIGEYKAAVEVNKHAYEFDLNRASQCMVPYLPEHNVNMLIYAAR